MQIFGGVGQPSPVPAPTPEPVAVPTPAPVTAPVPPPVEPGVQQRWSAFSQFVPDWDAW